MDVVNSAGTADDQQLDFFIMANKSKVVVDAAIPVLQGKLWTQPESLIVAQLLENGDLSSALEVIGSLNNEGARKVLIETGFSPQSTGDRKSMLSSVQLPLIRAAQAKLTGWDLQALEQGAPKEVVPPPPSLPESLDVPSFFHVLQKFEQCLKAPLVEVGVAGPDPLDVRADLQFVAAQAIERDVSGFAIPGIVGRFVLPESVALKDLRSLYGAANGAMAEAEVRGAMPAWAAGRNITRMTDLVPESAAKILRHTASVDGAQALRAALADGSIQANGADVGLRLASQILANQGVNLNAPPLEDLMAHHGLRLETPDTRKGQYFGRIIEQDHFGSLFKISKDAALIISHQNMPQGVDKPALGDMIHVKFSAERMSVNVQPALSPQSLGGR